MAISVHYSLKVGLSAAVFAASLPVAHAEAPASANAAAVEEIIVTARKRDEGIQSVPISIQALSSEILEQRNVREIQDLNVVVPGFRFGGNGGRGVNDVIMRGLSKIPLGEGVPAVVTYFAGVALPANGSNLPTYDIANIQVLKGPQGTLFGRNTLGGAVVITPEAPSYEFGGYFRGAYGTKNYQVLEGAVNVPVVADRVALRFAGQLRRQDGMNKNLSGGADFDDIHQNSYRISLLLNPTDTIQSTTVYDHFSGDETASAPYILRTNTLGMTAVLPGILAQYEAQGFIASAAAATAAVTGQINNFLTAGHRAGIHAAYTDLPDGGFLDRNIWGVSNDTSWDLGGATLRNVMGYRRSYVDQNVSSSGTGPLTIPSGFAAPAVLPFTLFDANRLIDRKYLSDELQVFGTAFDDRLDWIVGAFYNKDEPAGPTGTKFTAFSPVAGPATTAHVKNENKAIFAQVGMDISEWTIEGLKLNLGARYSWDDASACGGSNGPTYMTVGQCENIAATGSPTDGIGLVKSKGEAPSWTIGLDWQVTPDTLLYIASRHGYRGVNVNTPLFESAYTTGGSVCGVSGTDVCVDLRPYQKTKEEKITDVEVGVKNDWNIGDVKGRANLAAYVTKNKDAVQFVNSQAVVSPFAPDSPSDGSLGVNAADLTIKGVEIDLTVLPISGLTLTFAGAYTDQKIDSVAAPVVPGLSLAKDEITLPSPKFAGTFAFSWTLPVQPLDGDLILNGDYYHTDKFSGQNGENLPGYSVTSFRLTWNEIVKSGLNLSAYVKNAFDEEYFTGPTVLIPSFPVSVVLPGDPRTWGVEATYRF